MCSGVLRAAVRAIPWVCLHEKSSIFISLDMAKGKKYPVLSERDDIIVMKHIVHNIRIWLRIYTLAVHRFLEQSD